MKFNTTGKANIIIKSYNDYFLNKKSFKKGQPITILKDVSYSLSFHSENREMRAGVKNIGSFSHYAPYQITIDPVNITESLAEILYKERIKGEYFKNPVIETRESDENGVIILNQTNHTGIGILKDDFFILDKNRDIILAAINYETGVISDLKPEESYLISYYVSEAYDLFYKLGKTTIPYFSIEIQNRDDLGAYGINTLLKIPKGSLIIDPELNFDKNNITNIPLVFNILDEDVEIIFHK